MLSLTVRCMRRLKCWKIMPRAAQADDTEDVTPIYREGNVLQRKDLSIRGVVNPCEANSLDHRGRSPGMFRARICHSALGFPICSCQWRSGRPVPQHG